MKDFFFSFPCIEHNLELFKTNLNQRSKEEISLKRGKV